MTELWSVITEDPTSLDVSRLTWGTSCTVAEKRDKYVKAGKESIAFIPGQSKGLRFVTIFSRAAAWLKSIISSWVRMGCVWAVQHKMIRSKREQCHMRRKQDKKISTCNFIVLKLDWFYQNGHIAVFMSYCATCFTMLWKMKDRSAFLATFRCVASFKEVMPHTHFFCTFSCISVVLQVARKVYATRGMAS